MADLKDTKFEILSKLDIRTCYKELGVEITGTTPNEQGWLACRAHGHQDRSPSAGINVGTGDAELTGRYKEFIGEGRSLSLFDFAVDIGKFPKFKVALAYYAEIAGVKLPRGRSTAVPGDAIKCLEWNESLAAHWCRHKKPCIPQAVKVSKARIAKYPKKTEHHTVLAFPILDARLGVDADPRGWVITDVSGQLIPLYQGKGVDPKMLKTMTLKGSGSGFLGHNALMRMKTAQVVWKVEGLTDMVALESLILSYDEPCNACEGRGCGACHKGKVFPYAWKHVAITTSGGSMENPDQYIHHFEGKTVVVVHDCDLAGQAGADKWFQRLATVAKECRQVRLPFEVAEKAGKDIRDWANTEPSHDYKALLKLASNDSACLVRKITCGQEGSNSLNTDSPECSQTVGCDGNLMHEKIICDRLGIQVIGEDAGLAIDVFSVTHGKIARIKSVSRLTYEELLQIAGPPADEYVNLNNDVDVPEMYKMPEVRKAIAKIAGHCRNSSGSRRGVGCHWATDVNGKKTGSIVVVGSRDGFEFGGCNPTARRVSSPIHGSHVLEFRNEGNWYDFSLVSLYLAKSQDQGWSESVVSQLTELLGHWNWKCPNSAPQVVCGLILASWVQSLWSWRPLVAVTGPSDAGKSTLFEMMNELFGRLTLRASRSSEAGIRQAVKNDSLVLLCDEFESDEHRNKILELLRTSSKGDQCLRGTADQDGRAFGLKHIVWVAAIEVGLKREPDRNRFIQLELKRPKKSDRGNMDWFPPAHELSDLGMKAFAVALRHVSAACRMADAIKSTKVLGVPGRVVELYSVPAGMLAAISGGDCAVAETHLRRYLECYESAGVVVSDEYELVHAILTSPVDLGPEGRPNVAQCLDSVESGGHRYRDAESGLERSGVRIVTLKKLAGRRVIFLSHSMIRRALLRDTDWRDQEIDRILLRLNGATRGKQRLGGQLSPGIQLPFDWFAQHFLGDPDVPEGNLDPGSIDTVDDDLDWG